MAQNLWTWVRNIDGATEPWTLRAKFQAGATQAIKIGEILEYTGATNTAFVPIDSDYNMATSGDLAIAAEEVQSGDLAGYYNVIVPRPGDVFRYALAAAGASAYGTALYYSASQALTITAGTNIIAYIAGTDHYPERQGHAAKGDFADRGTTIKTVSYALVSFRWPCSFGVRLHKRS